MSINAAAQLKPRSAEVRPFTRPPPAQHRRREEHNGSSGMQVMQVLRGRAHEIKVIALTNYAEPQYGARFLARSTCSTNQTSFVAC